MERVVNFYGCRARRNLAMEHKTSTHAIYGHEVTEVVLNSVNAWLAKNTSIHITHRWIGMLKGDILVTLMFEESEGSGGGDERIVSFDGSKIRENVAKRVGQSKDSVDHEEVASLLVKAANNWLSGNPGATLTHRFTTILGQDMLIVFMYSLQETP